MPPSLLTVEVSLKERSYDVLVGDGAITRLASLLPSSARRCAVVTQQSIPVALDTGLEDTVVEIPPGEAGKTLATIEHCCRAFARAGLNRSDVVVTVGGGLVSDVGGMAAALFHRGTPVIHVPTTLLAQIDAAIGGKTAVNLPEGKNLVGAFWQPAGVICDTSVLATLPPAEWRSGYGEMAKYAFLGIEDLSDLSLEEQVARCVELKATFVAADERESERRMLLNYGHTLAHALEAAGMAGDGDALRHGEAVAIGLVFAALLARRLGRISDERVRRHEAVVESHGLSWCLPESADPGQIISFMARDKKARNGLTFVLDGPKGVEPVFDVAEDDVLAALDELAERSKATLR